MGTEPQQGLTSILGRARAGDERARGELVVLVYDELRRMASRLMRRERSDRPHACRALRPRLDP
jgi:hypothetical protein